MIRDELLAIQVGAPASEQGRRARMVQPDVVQHGDARETGTGTARDSRGSRNCRPGRPSGRTGRCRCRQTNSCAERVPAARSDQRLVDEHVDLVLLSSGLAASSALQTATPDRAGGIGLNHARRAIGRF